MAERRVNIGETIVYGIAFDPKNSQRVLGMDLNQLFASVGRLFDLLGERSIDYVLVGRGRDAGQPMRSQSGSPGHATVFATAARRASSHAAGLLPAGRSS
ncbi:MAG: hypothetical protein AAGB00_08740 [Planctomycetota bacterium]